MQEAARKDIERAFGVVTSRFAMLKNPARLWNKEDLGTIMRACIVLHNMIIEDERDSHLAEDFIPTNDEDPVNNGSFVQFLENYAQVHDAELHKQLQNDLIEHLWQLKGDEEDWALHFFFDFFFFS